MKPLVILKDILGLPATPDAVNDPILQGYVDRAVAQVESYIGHKLATTSYDEPYENYSPTLFTSKWPIVLVTSINLSGTAQALTDFIIEKETGQVAMADPVTRKMISMSAGGVLNIAYDAGYGVDQDFPIWLSEIVANLAARISNFKNKPLDDNISSEAIAGVYSVNYRGLATASTATNPYPFIPDDLRSVIDNERGRTI